MGIRYSSSSSNSYQFEPDTPTSTAKVIHQDGQLQEFNYPVKVSHVIDPSETFLCDSEEMDFDAVVSAVSHDSDLQPGQLYFVLPVSKLSQPLLAEEMALLAVKAHAALVKADSREGGGKKKKCGWRSKEGEQAFFVESWRDKDGNKMSGGSKERESMVVGGRKKGAGRPGRRNGVSGGGGSGRSRRKVFAVKLSTIEE